MCSQALANASEIVLEEAGTGQDATEQGRCFSQGHQQLVFQGSGAPFLGSVLNQITVSTSLRRESEHSLTPCLKGAFPVLLLINACISLQRFSASFKKLGSYSHWFPNDLIGKWRDGKYDLSNLE